MIRKIFIGDIHGCYQELILLLEKLNYCKNSDQLYFVGDIINRGPSSKKVLDFAISEKVKVILGNHELSLIRSIFLERDDRFKDLISQIGDDFYDYYLPYIKSFQPYIEEKDFILVHAGICPGFQLDEVDPYILTTIRTWDGIGYNLNRETDPAWYNYYYGSKLVIHGHWAEKGLHVSKNVVGLDSGCVWGGKLSALILPEFRIVQVDSLQTRNKFM